MAVKTNVNDIITLLVTFRYCLFLFKLSKYAENLKIYSSYVLSIKFTICPKKQGLKSVKMSQNRL